jgi:D-aminoacyl-tRNA deacylase
MKLIITSTKDIASTNIARLIIDLYTFKKTSETFDELPIYQQTIDNEEIKLVTITSESIHAQFITEHFAPNLLIFISRHSSQSGIPTLSVHTPGNLTNAAEKGGTPREISIAPATAMKEALKEMARQVKRKQLAYKVSYECTHHGPSLNVPTMFAELGSSPAQWKDAEAAEAVAHATLAAIKAHQNYPAAIGIGGPHYNEEFTKIALITPTAFGHMIPKYAIDQIDAFMLKQCIERTMEKTQLILLDWKGIKGENKEKLIKTINILGLKTEKV